MPVGLLQKETDTPLDDRPESQPPIHKLKDIKAGENSVQLLISTKDHVYDADGVEAGNDSWQVIGAWDESALSELSKFLSTRQQTATQGGSSQGVGFGSRFGGGQKLGSQ